MLWVLYLSFLPRIQRLPAPVYGLKNDSRVYCNTLTCSGLACRGYDRSTKALSFSCPSRKRRNHRHTYKWVWRARVLLSTFQSEISGYDTWQANHGASNRLICYYWPSIRPLHRTSQSSNSYRLTKTVSLTLFGAHLHFRKRIRLFLDSTAVGPQISPSLFFAQMSSDNLKT